MHQEDYKTMEQVSTKLNAISLSLSRRDDLDAKRRLVDDARDATLLARVDEHGRKQTELETKWNAFFSDQGGWGYVSRKITTTDTQNRWIIGGVGSILVAVIIDLLKHR
jgi:hypothetical protein